MTNTNGSVMSELLNEQKKFFKRLNHNISEIMEEHNKNISSIFKDPLIMETLNSAKNTKLIPDILAEQIVQAGNVPKLFPPNLNKTADLDFDRMRDVFGKEFGDFLEFALKKI